MKVAFLVGQFPSLSETFILDQIISLITRGHDVEIFALRNPADSKVHGSVEKYQLLSRTHYFPEMPTGRLRRIAKGIVLFLYHFPRHPRRILACLRVFKLGRDALSLNLLYYNIPFLNKTFDILHCHFGHNGLIGLFVKKVCPEMKLVATFHGYDMSEFLRIRGRDAYRELFFLGDLFLPISRYWEKKLIDLGCDPEKIHVLHMGINMECFRFRVRKKPESGRITILTLGRLVEKKGHEFVLRALVEVVRVHQNLRYVIAGTGPLKSSLQNLTQELGIGPYVHYVGACDQKEALDLYRQAHLFVLASITSESGDQEGIPVVLMEAQAMGLPVISTYHSGIPEGVAEGKSGLLVRERDSRTLAEKILYLLDNPLRWPEMGREGRRYVEGNFNQEILNHRLEMLFGELIFNEQSI